MSDYIKFNAILGVFACTAWAAFGGYVSELPWQERVPAFAVGWYSVTLLMWIGHLLYKRFQSPDPQEASQT